MSPASSSVQTSEKDDFNKPWPLVALPSYPYNGDLSKDFAEYIQGEMILVHNIFIRSLNVLWTNAPLVAAKDVSAYANYGIIALHAIHAHHDSEDQVFFPAVRKLGMEEMVVENLEQHAAFHDGMEAFGAYLRGVVSGNEAYDADKVRSLLKAFADPLVDHLHKEARTCGRYLGRSLQLENRQVPTVRPEVMHKLDKSALQKIHKDLAYVHGHGGFTTTIPFMLTGHNPVHAPSWPLIPRPMKWVALNVLPRVHSSYWKFAPYTTSGKPQQYTP